MAKCPDCGSKKPDRHYARCPSDQAPPSIRGKVVQTGSHAIQIDTPSGPITINPGAVSPPAVSRGESREIAETSTLDRVVGIAEIVAVFATILGVSVFDVSLDSVGVSSWSTWTALLVLVAFLILVGYVSFRLTVRQRPIPIPWSGGRVLEQRGRALALTRLQGACGVCSGSLRLRRVVVDTRTERDDKGVPHTVKEYARLWVCTKNPELHRFPFDHTQIA